MLCLISSMGTVTKTVLREVQKKGVQGPVFSRLKSDGGVRIKISEENRRLCRRETDVQ